MRPHRQRPMFSGQGFPVSASLLHPGLWASALSAHLTRLINTCRNDRSQSVAELGRSQKSCKADENPQQASLLSVTLLPTAPLFLPGPRLKADMSPECGLRWF